MTTQERISMIGEKRILLDNAEDAKKREEESLRAKLENEIFSMRERIQNVIEVGNALSENGFLETEGFRREDKRLKPYGYDGSVVAEGFYHHVGFMPMHDGKVAFLGFECGGACGMYDFYTNGAWIYSVHEKTLQHQPIIPVAHLQKFVREFPQFENALYAKIVSSFSAGRSKMNGWTMR